MLEILKEIFAAILPIIEKEAIPAIEDAIIAKYKPEAIEWLNGRITHKQTQISDEQILVASAKIGGGELRDEIQLGVYKAELVLFQKALTEVQAFELPTQDADKG